MVNNGYCAVLGNFRASQTIKVGDTVTQPKTGPIFSDLAARWQRLPIKLQ